MAHLTVAAEYQPGENFAAAIHLFATSPLVYRIFIGSTQSIPGLATLALYVTVNRAIPMPKRKANDDSSVFVCRSWPRGHSGSTALTAAKGEYFPPVAAGGRNQARGPA